jgi:O-antigen/teichoic acid export membrane protein
MSTSKKFAKQTVIYGLSTVITRSLYFILTPIYVGVLSAKVYGVFTKMYSWSSLINAALSFGMETAFFRYLNKYKEHRQQVYSNSLAVVVMCCSLFIFLVYIFIEPIAFWLSGNDQSSFNDYVLYIISLSIVLVMDAICTVPFALIRSNNKPLRYALIKIVNIIIVVFLNLFFLFGIPFIIKNNFVGAQWVTSWYRSQWVGYIFISNTIASLFTFLLLLPEVVQFKFKFDKSIFREMVFYSIPILIANISFIINENLDKILLGKLLPASISDEQVGIYGACAKLSLFLSLFIQAFRLGAEPFFFSHMKNENAKETYAKIMDYFVIVITLIFVAIVVNIEILKYFINGKDAVQQSIYWSGLKVVPILLFGYVSLGIYMNLSIWYKLTDQTKYGLYIAGIGAILTIVLNIIYIPVYSYMASAWISLISYTVMMVLTYLYGRSKYPIPYNLKSNFFYIGLSLIIVVLSFLVFKRDIYIGNSFLIFFIATIIIREKSAFVPNFRK